MRKFTTAVLVLIIVTAIALLARPQVREAVAPAAPRADGPPSVPASEVTRKTRPEPEAQPVITKVAKAPPTLVSGAPSARPVVSGDIELLTAPVSDTSVESEQDGATILKRASAAYTRVKSMQADFVQRRENPLLNSTYTSRGTLYQKSPDRFALKFSDPAGDIIVGDGRYFWVYYPSADKRQVIRANAGAGGAGAVDLQAQFIGDPVRRFKYTYEGSQKAAGRSAYVLTLVPRENAGYKSMKVWVDANDSLVRRFQITEQTGAKVEFQLSNLKVNPVLANDIFRFTPPAGAQVIER